MGHTAEVKDKEEITCFLLVFEPKLEVPSCGTILKILKIRDTDALI